MMARLGDIATVITKGTTPTSLGFNFQTDGVNFIKIESIDENGKFICEKFDHINEACHEKLKRSQLQENDILFSIAGAIGRTAVVTKEILPANTNQALAIIRIPQGKINYSFLLYILQSSVVMEQAEKKKQGVAQLNLSLKDIGDLIIPDIPIEQQQEIVNNLNKVSNLILLRKQQLSKLDKLVKTRFVEMFRESKQYPKEALNNNVEQMFIGPFGSALKNEYFVDESDAYCMVYEQKHAIQKTMDLPTRYVNEEKYKELKRFEIHGGDIIVSCRGTIGEIYSIPNDAPMGIMHPSIMKIRLNKEKYCNLFFVFMLEEFMRESIKKANGSGIKMAITATELGKELFVVPPIEKQNEFETFVKQIDKSKFDVQQSLEKLETLKKSLMQQYFG